jgi:hypothetical protein
MRTADLAPQSGSKDYDPETGVANERRCDHARHERYRRSVLGVESARKKPRAPRTGSATVVARRGHSDPFISGERGSPSRPGTALEAVPKDTDSLDRWDDYTKA